MESVDLQMEDIFEMDGEEDDTEFQSLAPLPDLPEDAANGEGDQNAEEAENMEVLARLKDLSKGASKRVVKRPQPKLDPERLTGERGIAILPKVFEKVKFKGKGHEAEDLGVIMHHLEHWGHRLFPKMPFDEVLQRIEKLGSKKEVQTCIKKIRMDMPVLNVDFFKDEDEEDNVKRGNKEEAPVPVVDVDTENVWEELMKEEREKRIRESQPATQPSSTYQTPRTPAQQPVHSNHLTPEQLERIEQNKRLALERKAKKFGTPLPSTASPSQEQLTQTPETRTQNDKGRDEQNLSTKESRKIEGANFTNSEDENFPENITDRDMESELNFSLKGAKNYDDEHQKVDNAECKTDTPVCSTEVIDNDGDNTECKTDTPACSNEVIDNDGDVENDMQDIELDQDQLMDELDN